MRPLTVTVEGSAEDVKAIVPAGAFVGAADASTVELFGRTFAFLAMDIRTDSGRESRAELVELRPLKMAPAPGPAAPADADPDPAFEPYDRGFLADVEKLGFEAAFMAWSAGGACGCLGPRDGDPFCPCEMRFRTVRRHGAVVRR